MNNSEIQKNRQKTLEYITESYPSWPQGYNTYHTGVSHYGYSWTKLKNQNDIDEPYVLEHENGDVISESDYNSEIIKTAPERVLNHIYLATEHDGNKTPVLWNGDSFLKFGDSKAYKEYDFASVSTCSYDEPDED